MNLGHPTLKDMINLGCKSQVKILLAFQTYIELCEVQKAQEVGYKYSPQLDLIYLTASCNGEQEIYVPLSQNNSISPQLIKSYQKCLTREADGKAIHIAVRDVDTSCIIYKMSQGLEKPLSPEISKEKKDFKEKLNLIEIEISSLLPSLIQEARSKVIKDS